MQVRRDKESIIDIEYLTNVQKCISKALGVYTCCLDSAGVPVLKLSGPEEEANKLMEYVPSEAVADIFFRLTGSGLEDQVIEDTSVPNIKFGLTTVRVNGQPIVTWVVYGVIEDYDPEGYILPPAEGFSRTVEYDRFIASLDFIRVATAYQIDIRMSFVSAEE